VNDNALMALHAAALFTYDERGRMVWTNEPDRLPAPLVFLGQTATGSVARFGASLSDASVSRLQEIIGRFSTAGDLAIPPALGAAIRESLARDAPVAGERGGPVYRFPASIARPDDGVEITDANLGLVRETFSWLYDDLNSWRPCFAVIADGGARSVCFSSRVTATAMEAGVFTAPGYRGRHFAAAATAAWGAAIQAMDRVPLYSTDWTNPASQAVARRAGLVMFGADASWR
jgi:hypothetical protein